MDGKAIIALVALAIGVAIFFVRVSARSESRDRLSGEVKQSAIDLCAGSPLLAGKKQYVDYLIEACHKDAFEAACPQSYARRGRYEFDEGKYWGALFAAMQQRARDENRGEVAELVKKFQEAEAGAGG